MKPSNTDVPCPPWCEREPGHPFLLHADLEDTEPGEHRIHAPSCSAPRITWTWSRSSRW